MLTIFKEQKAKTPVFWLLQYCNDVNCLEPGRFKGLAIK